MSSKRSYAVSACNLSKSYSIAVNSGRVSTLAELLTQKMKRPFERADVKTFWALKDVSFEIEKGDVVGIIGRNGAGKSTLLKVLSRITEPTQGRAVLNGRVSSLLEVGTGFHAELTGRENIALNGAILGMSRREISRQFDEIVDFAGVEQFLDTPVKRYSSGMYVRLAFAVAAHLNPDILIIDEVLAVGDVEFQKKCLGKMETVAKSGRTVLFVSHNMAAINHMCNTCLVLQSGSVAFFGDTESATKHYLATGETVQASDDLGMDSFRPSWAKPYITGVKLLNADDVPVNIIPLGSPVTFEVTFAAPPGAKVRWPVLGVVINHTTFGMTGAVNSRMTNFEVSEGPYQSGKMRCTIEHFPLLQGRYTVDIWLGDGSADVDALIGSLRFDIEDSDVYGSGKVPFSNMGVMFFYPKWQLEAAQNAVLV